MNHLTVAKSICGNYRELSATTGYLESHLAIPRDGTLIGAYVLAAGQDRVVITDDGDTLFSCMAAGAHVTKARSSKYREIAEACGLKLNEAGELSVACEVEHISFYMARFLEAASQIAFVSLDHRPKTRDRFEELVGTVLNTQFQQRLSRQHHIVGASGHTLRFPFALDATSEEATVIQPVASDDGKVDWANVYQAGGKFRDLMNNLSIKVRRVAVLEPADEAQITQARVALGDAADVILYRGPEQLRRALQQH